MNPASPSLTKPALRGHSHQAAFFCALGAGAMLLREAAGSDHFFHAAVYVFSLCLMFGVSAVYHRPNWSPNSRAWFRKLDHAAIYFLIAGSATPIAACTLSPESMRTLLTLMWGAALLGCLQSLIWIRAPKALSFAFYVFMVWLSMPYLADIGRALHDTGMALLVSGFAAFFLGGLSYALKRPNFFSGKFGYHEVFHAWVILGCILHFVLIERLVNSR